MRRVRGTCFASTSVASATFGHRHAQSMLWTRELSDYTPFLSRVAKRRQPSAIRTLAPLLKIPGMISLGGGNPNPTYFPIKELELTLKDGDAPIAISGEDLDAALSYSPSYGIPRLVEWLKDHQLKEHNPPYKKRDDWHVCVTTGSSEGNSKAFEMLLDEGDHVLTENPTYSGALAGLRPLGCHLTGIKTDQFGLVPAELRRVLENWPKQNPLPKALYIIPTGQNPSGSTLALERRHEIYSLASKFNFLILEDDPYYHLQLAENPKHVPSFFSLDTEGRVLRFDSFSKIISSGLRLGWVTGPMPLVERLQLHQQSSSLHASGLAQIVLLRILEKWGQKGLEDHLRAVRKGYTERRDTFCRLAEKYLSGLAEWSAPEAGMFVWFKIPGIDSTEKLIKERAVQQKVLLVPGAAFTPQEGEPSPYVRASFSTATTEEMEEALKRFANLITEERKARQK